VQWRNRLYVFTENTVPDELWIRGLYPKGNENFYSGSVRFIQWASAVPGGVHSNVKIEISAFGPEGPWWLVADSLPNNGKYQWTVPEFGSDDCYLRFTVTTETETNWFISEVPFTIFGEPTSSGEITHRISEYASLMPNPGSGHVYINSLKKVERITFYNSTGVMMLKLDQPGKHLDLSQLPTGIYVFRMIMETGQVNYGKWIKSSH
jgi:hypothetical protein